MSSGLAGWRIALWVVIAIATLAFLYAVRGILSPFILAFLISAILQPGVNRLVSKGWKRGSASVSLMLLFFGSIVALLVLLTPVVSQQIGGFKDRAEMLARNVAQPNPNDNFFMRGVPSVRVANAARKDPVDSFLGRYSDVLSQANLPTTKRAIIAQYIEPQRGQIQKTVQGALKASVSIASGLVSQGLMLIFVPLLVGLILPNAEDIRKRLFGLIPPQLRTSAEGISEDIGDVFSNYLRGVAIAVFGYMAFMGALLSILGAPYGLLLGVLFGALYLIPYLNVAIAATTLFVLTGLSGKTDWLMIHFSSSWIYAGVLVGIYMVCHFVFDSIVYPRFVGNAVGLHPILSMFVIFSGGALFGLPGMVLAFPVAGSIKVLLDRVIGFTNKTDGELILPEVPLRHREVIS
jgi:predicted PurR-regulated permease PerM